MLRQWSFSAVICLSIAFSFSLVLNRDLREFARGQLYPEFREVVSKVDGDLFGTGENIRVLKIKSNQGLFVEIYKEQQNGQRDELIQRIDLSGSRDAYFSFNGEATNLALDDVNRDSRPEILIPSMDSKLVAKMLILELDPQTQTYRLSQTN